MKTQPLVSVIIPIYNCAQYIEEAINSVLEQKKVSFEIILINDGSTDSLYDILSKYLTMDNIVYVENKKNIGVALSRNLGVKIARGKYIAYLDADDYWLPLKLEKQIKVLESNDIAICYTGRELLNSDGSTTGKVIKAKKYIKYKNLLLHNYIPCSSVMLPINIAKAVPMCRDDLHEDYINWLKILKTYGVAYGINEPLIKYRLSMNSKSRDVIKSANMTFGVYRYLGYGHIVSFLLLMSHILHNLVKFKK